MKITHIKRMRDLRKKRVAAYCRVSTRLEDQAESLETQQKIYANAIKANPEWEFAGIYSDEKSGTKVKNRPGFKQMTQDAIDGKIDLILCKSISRFARNVVDCQNYAGYLQGNGVDVYFEKEHISSGDPLSSMVFSFMSAIAQNESESIGENVRWGYITRFRRGEYNLGNNRILGYDTVEGKLVPNRDAWMVRLMYRLFLEGKPYQQISATIFEAGGVGLRSGKPLSNAAILAILRNETYVGDKRLQKKPHISFLTKKPDKRIPYESRLLTDEHERIVDRETWEAVQQILDRRKQERESGITRNGSENPLYGKFICGKCGAVYTRRTLRGYGKEGAEGLNYKAWSCRERVKGKKGNGCKNVTIRESDLLRRVSKILGWTWNGAEKFDAKRFGEAVEKVEITASGVTVRMKRSER